MAKRPILSEDSFLKHLFSPKKNPLPTGIRKRALSFVKGRTKARVASYNRMSGASQETLRRAGLRDAYLQGQATLTDAKKTLRGQAVSKGFAKPLRARIAAATRQATGSGRTQLDMQVAGYVIRTLRTSGVEPHKLNTGRIYANMKYVPDEDIARMSSWDSGRIKAYASDSSKAIIIEGESRNPLWYH